MGREVGRSGQRGVASWAWTAGDETPINSAARAACRVLWIIFPPCARAARLPGPRQDHLVKRSDIHEYKALPAYSEPDWVTKQFVDTGKLPPVKDRLPKEPLVFKTGNMPDGIGVYGDVMRHVIGGRPEGWNYCAGQTPGLGRHRHRPFRVPDPHRPALRG